MNNNHNNNNNNLYTTNYNIPTTQLNGKITDFDKILPHTAHNFSNHHTNHFFNSNNNNINNNNNNNNNTNTKSTVNKDSNISFLFNMLIYNFLFYFI